MDLKTKLEDEILFSEEKSLFFKHLNEKGIYTIEDYINADLGRTYQRIKHRGFQGILRYKYLDEPLVVDILLKRKYGREEINLIIQDMRKLGFEMYHKSLYNLIKDLNPEKDYVKMIDIINKLSYYTGYINIKNFYIEYYNNVTKQENVGKDEKETLESLKNELTNLIKRRNELDSKISSLLEQVNALEGEQNVNGRK